jgi:hypothetical protein
VHVEEDFGKVTWPATELVSSKSWLWVINQGEKWPYLYFNQLNKTVSLTIIRYQLPKANLQVQNILQHLQSYTGMSYMGPNSFYEGLERLANAMDKEANLSSINSKSTKWLLYFFYIQKRYWKGYCKKRHLEEIE